MRGEFFIDGDKIFLFPQKCVLSWSQYASNAPPVVTHGGCIPIQSNLPIPSLTISESSNNQLASIMSGSNTNKQPSQSISLMSLNNSIVSSQSANNFSFTLIMPGTDVRSIHPSPTMAFSNSSNTPSPSIIPVANIAQQPLNSNPAMSLHIAKGQSANNFSSALIMTGAELKRRLIQAIPTVTLSQSASNFPSSVIMSGAELNRQPIQHNSATTLSQSGSNVPLINSEPYIDRPIQSTSTLSQSVRNVHSSYSSSVMPSSISNGVSQDPTILITKNETETIAPPEYLKSQRGGSIMYYSSYLYTTSKKKPNKTYYRCHTLSCLATAFEVNSLVVVKHQHNHDPPREEYEAMVTREKLKEAAVANPSLKLRHIYHQTLISRLSELPNLCHFPKAAPPLQSVRMTMKRAIKARQSSPLCKNKVQLGSQSSPQNQLIDLLLKQNKLLN